MSKLKGISHNLIKLLRGIENGALVTSLGILILLSFSQIVMRNFFSTGLFWGDAVSRYLVLWVGLLGAMIATRDDHHISIDIISRFASARLKSIIRVITDSATVIISSILTYTSILFIKDELSLGAKAFGSIPTWIAGIILPVAFGAISLRYTIYLFNHLVEAVTGRFNPEKTNPGADIS